MSPPRLEPKHDGPHLSRRAACPSAPSVSHSGPRGARAPVPISVVIERVVKLRKTGNILVGLCPFHGEATPSFAVYARGGDRVRVPFFVCYGCGLKGDVIKFVME